MPYIGEILSVIAAVAWAVGVILFKKSGDKMPPVALNLFKNVLALCFFVPTLLLTGQSLFPQQPLDVWLLLAASGFLGIAVADTLFFISLRKLGAGLVAVADTSYTPVMLLLCYFFLDERIGWLALVGAALIMGGLIVGSITRPQPGKSRRTTVEGIIIAILGISFMAVGIVIIKPMLGSIDLVWANTIRLGAGVAGLLPLTVFRSNRASIIQAFKPNSTWKSAFPATFFGTYIALAAWLGGMKYIDVSIAALLNQLSTIFIFIMAVVFLKEKLTVRRTVAILLAFSGAMLVLL